MASDFAGLLTGRLALGQLGWVMGAVGAFLLPAGLMFLLPVGTAARYAVTVAAFCGVQAAVSIFSIFAVSAIQQRTPGQLTGKVMACVATITLCAQPAGQLVYGVLFDGLRDRVWLVLAPTGVLILVITLLARGVFRELET